MIRIIILSGLLLATSLPVWALRCGSSLVDRGDHAVEVLAKCGPPAFSTSWELTRRYPYGRDARASVRRLVVIEEWAYNFGRSRFHKILRFENGYLVSIDSAGRGF